MIIAASHTHSGPATLGIFSPAERDYVAELIRRVVTAVEQAARNMQPVAVGCASGREETISHYRRLLADDGHVVMNWEPYPPEHVVGPLGVIDPQVGVLKVVPADKPDELVCLLFNHAGHPCVLSGDSYVISGDYAGLAEHLLEEKFGAIALFVNGAQGTMDIDGLKDRDWAGVERTGNALAKAVADTARTIVPSKAAVVSGAVAEYSVPARKITAEEWTWAQEILQKTGGTVQPLADGVGDDYKAVLYRDIREAEGRDINIQQVCLAVNGTAFISFPGELYTEIGMDIKAHSPFTHTYVVGLANGYAGYFPTRKAIAQGGYAEDMRRVDAAAEDIVINQSLALLRKVHASTEGVRR
jgi:hypothetical protein